MKLLNSHNIVDYNIHAHWNQEHESPKIPKAQRNLNITASEKIISMKVIQLSVFLTFLAFCCVSCKEYKKISVVVIDKVTKQPIDSVLVKVTDGKKDGGDWSNNAVTAYTDANGKFEATIHIGYAFGNNKIYLEYQKKGYAFKEEVNITDGVVELEQ